MLEEKICVDVDGFMVSVSSTADGRLTHIPDRRSRKNKLLRVAPLLRPDNFDISPIHFIETKSKRAGALKIIRCGKEAQPDIALLKGEDFYPDWGALKTTELGAEKARGQSVSPGKEATNGGKDIDGEPVHEVGE